MEDEMLLRQTRPCNCRNETSCPLQGKCLQKGVIYQATIMQSNKGKHDTYIILESQRTSSKAAMIDIYQASGLNIEYQQQQRAHLEVKKSEIDLRIKWEILDKALTYSASTRRCNLCIAERINILFKKPTLNKRRELYCTCLHRRKCLLCETAK